MGKQSVLSPGRIKRVAVCVPHWYSLRNRAGYLDSLLSLCLQSWLWLVSSLSPTLIAGDRTNPAAKPACQYARPHPQGCIARLYRTTARYEYSRAGPRPG